ncbi:LptF/LptG family permease [Thermovibrio sp.]
MRILHRYISYELLKNFTLTTALFIFIILMDRASFIAQTVLGQGVGLKDFLSVLIKTVPSFLGIVIPIAFVISTLITFIQMESNREITALKSCGISLKELSKPVFLLGALFSITSFIFLMFVAPISNVAVKKEVSQLLKKKLTLNITPKSFSSNFPGITFYVEKIYPQKGYIENFMVSIQKKLQLITIFGKRGILRTEKDRVFLDIFNGSAQVVDWKKPQDFKLLKFKSYTVELYKFSNKNRFNSAKYKTLLELLKERNKENTTEILKRLTLSFAPLIVGMLAFSIAISLPRGAVGAGVAFGLLIVVLYYVLYTFSKKFALKTGSPALALTPDLIFGALGAFLYAWAIKDRLNIEVGGRW